MKDATLCYIFDRGKVLLQKKAPGKFGEGKWNAPGGKLKFAEPPHKAAVREVREETGLEVAGLKQAGALNFMEEGGKWFTVHVFVAEGFSGEPVNRGEGELQWFPVNVLPYDDMWEDDRKWMPLLLDGKRFAGHFVFSKGFKSILESEVKELEVSA